MGFPTSPTDGQTATVNGVLYTYNSTLTAWTVGTEPGANLSGNNINVTGSAAVGTTLTVTGATTLSSTLGVTGTVTGGNVLTGGLISATGNVTGGNVLTGGLISATGNVTGGNVLTGGLLSAAGDISGSNLNITGNIVDTGALSIITSANGSISLSPGGTGSVNATRPVVVLFDGGANLTNADNMFEIQDNGATSTPSMAFHRPTLYATKITLNTDNVLYFGGYSAASGGQTIVSGTHNPGATNTYDLGTASLRWRNIFTQDLQLNNGIGDYTIVEGEDDLFLYNNKKGKVYKFALIEVDPTTAPPKAKTD
jgi:hypothetical protein